MPSRSQEDAAKALVRFQIIIRSGTLLLRKMDDVATTIGFASSLSCVMATIRQSGRMITVDNYAGRLADNCNTGTTYAAEAMMLQLLHSQ